VRQGSDPKFSAYVQLDRVRGGGGGLAIVGGAGTDEFTVTFDEGSSSFSISAAKGVAVGPGCERFSATQVSCLADPARWLMADLGPGDDRFRVEGSLEAAENVRIAGGLGDDTIRGGPEDDLIESGPGSDRLHGGAGADGLTGGLPGPTFLYGEEDGDLLAAGGGCAGGAIVGGPGRDDASFAETQAHPGLLYISFPLNKAWVDVVPGCQPVRLDDSNEDMEGSFDNDVLIGDSGKNALLGQPGQDSFFGNGGDDVIDARDGVRDFHIQCARTGGRAGRALTDSFDPFTTACEVRTDGEPVKGLNNGG
jgi:Ca2+-binding RTX toxin-like protein